MVKLTKTTLFKAQFPKPETPMDKTSRIVRKLADDEAAQRMIKTARLRTARLEREANTPGKTDDETRKTPAAKAKRS